MRSGVRFWPPQVPLDFRVQWSLLRAFGPAATQAPALPRPSETLDIARRLGLVSRIFGRSSHDQLQSELGAQFDISRQGVHVRAARGLALERCTRVVDSVAQSIGTPFSLIKGAALVRVGVASIGHRDACDVDILVSEPDAERMQSALKTAGFRQRTPTHPPYHLPVLMDNAAGAIEIHTCLPHVRLSPGGHHVTYDELESHARLAPATGLSQFAFVPTSDVLVAHAIAHGVVQHGFVPEGYPLLRMLADIIDLRLTSSPSLSEQVYDWIRSDVTPDEFAALRDIANGLQIGDVEHLWNDGGFSGRMLRHLICGTLDEEYRRGLKLYQVWHSLRSTGMAAFLSEYGRSAFAPSRSDMTKIYGEASQDHMLRHQLLRPFDVASRILRMIPSASKIASRQIADRLGR